MAHRSWLARLGLAGALAIAGTGIALGAAAPASATVANASVAAPAGTITINAVATCPAGQYLTGAGGWVDGGGGDVALTDVIPDIGARTVTAWAHAVGVAVPGAYRLQAQAICLPGPPPPNYQLVVSPSAANPMAIKTQGVNCPAGTSLLGLGARLDNANGNALYQSIRPTSLTTGLVTAAAAGGFAANWSLTGYGICATPVAGFAPQPLSAATGPSNSLTPKLTNSPVCPAGTQATGVGGTVEATAAGNVMLDRLTANNAPQNMATSGADENGTYLPAWTLTAHDICWG